MKKYIVQVQYTKPNHDLVWLVKAKNDIDLEYIMAEEYSDCLSLIDGYEYEQLNNRMFKKHDTKLVLGNWVGVEIMKDDLKKRGLKKMNRLTRRSGIGYIARNQYCDYDAVLTDAQLEAAYSQCVYKLGELEDIEEELGIDLITLLTVLTNGYAFWKYDNFIYKVEIEGITNCHLKVNTWYYEDFNKNGKRYGDKFSIDIKDYGKMWALTEAELRNEK